MSVSSEVNRLRTAKNDLAETITNKGVPVSAGSTLDSFPALVDKIPAIKSGSFTMTSTAQTKSVNIGFTPTNVLVFYSENETPTTARGVFGWARTTLFSALLEYIKSSAATRTTWSNFTIGSRNPYLEFTDTGFTLSVATTTSPILVGTYNWVVW